MAAFGATVVKIERPPNGDWTRSTEPSLPGVSTSEASTLFLHLNMGKQSVVLDWQTEDGHHLLERLLDGADVVIEDWDSHSPVPRALLQEAKARHPGLIDISLTPFGTTGPYAAWKSTPLVNLALGGFLYLSGDEDREPLMLPGHQSEHLLGLHGFIGAMMSLWKRDADGRARYAEVSEVESLAALHQFTLVMHTYSGLVRRRHGARWENQGNYGRYPIALLPCKDGYMSYAVSTEGQWEMLFPMIGRPELNEEHRFADVADRKKHLDEIDALLIDWMKDKTRQEIFEFAAGTWSEPASPLLELSEVLEDPQLRLREFFTDVDHPDAGVLTYPTVPFRMTAMQPTFSRAPRLGEHTQTAAMAYEGRPSRASASSHLEERSGGVLDDVRIVDLTRVWAGPLATRILGDFGADIVKISDPRALLDRTSGLSNKLNRNKPSISLRLDQDAGREAFLELVAVSDVVVENFRPRVMRNFGLTYEDLRKVRPDIVMCSMPGYGTQGSYAEYPAFGPSVEATTGLSSMMGYEDGPPRTSAFAYPDPIAGLNAVVAIMAALRHRRYTGHGQFIDLALSEGTICQIGEYIAAHSRTGLQPPRRGNQHPDHAPYGVYPASGDDNWVAVCVTSDEQWRALCDTMGSPVLRNDPRFAERAERRRNATEVDAIVAGWTAGRDAAHVMETLQAVEIAAGLVANNRQLLEDPHLNDRGFFVELEEPDVGPKVYDGQAIKMEGMDPSTWVPSERLGESSFRILEELLGLSITDIESLERREIIGVFRED